MTAVSCNCVLRDCVQTGIVATNVSAAFVRVDTDLASGIVVYSSADKRVFGAVVCLNLTSGAASVNGPACTSSTIPRPLVAGFAPQPLQLHVGDHPSVDVGLGADGEVYVLEVCALSLGRGHAFVRICVILALA